MRPLWDQAPVVNLMRDSGLSLHPSLQPNDRLIDPIIVSVRISLRFLAASSGLRDACLALIHDGHRGA